VPHSALWARILSASRSRLRRPHCMKRSSGWRKFRRSGRVQRLRD